MSLPIDCDSIAMTIESLAMLNDGVSIAMHSRSVVHDKHSNVESLALLNDGFSIAMTIESLALLNDGVSIAMPIESLAMSMTVSA